MSGLEGSFGLLILVVYMIILNLIPCSRDLHSYCDIGNVLMNTWASIDIIFHSWPIALLLLGFLIAGAGYKISSVYLV